jgi:hypothetical protein
MLVIKFSSSPPLKAGQVGGSLIYINSGIRAEQDRGKRVRAPRNCLTKKQPATSATDPQ